MIPAPSLTPEQAQRVVTPFLITELAETQQALIDMLDHHADELRQITELFKKFSERDRRVQALISAQVACHE